ncbi:MAG: hypothetical protein K0S56_3463 [Microvirga sp.]|nr:hypothetical protein [Microvirga sp.]
MTIRAAKPAFFAAVIGLTVILSGCQTADIGPIDTTAQAMITTSAPASTIRNVLVYQAVNKNNLVVSDTPKILVVDMRSNDFLYSVVLKHRWDPTARARITYVFDEKGGKTTVSAAATLVANRSGMPQQVTDFEGNPDVQAALQRLLNEAAAKAQ